MYSVNPLIFEGNLFWTTNYTTSSFLDDAHEIGGISQAVDGAGVQPDVAALQGGDRAISLMNENDIEFEGAVSRVEADQNRADEVLARAEAMEAEANRKLMDAEEKLAAAKDSKRRIIESAKEEARDIISDANRTVKEVSKELRKAAKENRDNSSAAVAESKRKLREKYIKNAAAPKEVKNSNVPKAEELKRGTRIKLLKLGQNGEVETPPDASGSLTVRIGALTH